ncbi:hypothetical protein [Microlunatus speluncae]|uniref:hypothetical protein n=1 Tax=Microlunatus speluncae TaxID=2594267 RepID=UPI0012666610|nr:hypothetical protein [Microlunatus speluncae]
MAADGPVLRPLGTLGPPPDGTPWSADQLDRTHPIDPDLKERVITYLSGCPLFLAWMEYTRDELGDRFGVAGGSAIASDGLYYWRLDAIDYLREYDIAVPPEAIGHFESRQWQPPEFDRPDYLAIYQKLEDLLVPGF